MIVLTFVIKIIVLDEKQGVSCFRRISFCVEQWRDI